MFEEFDQQTIALESASINVVTAGAGPALLLLHGYPQTHVMWHKIAPILAEHYRVVIPDLRGYGDSTGPASEAGNQYSKRLMAADQVQLMQQLGHARFSVCGHDRGGRVAYRMALDHDCIDRLATLDIIPTLEQFERMGHDGALSTYHWYFLAQPAPFPETLIGGDPGYFLQHTINSWCRTEGAITAEAMNEYRRCFSKPAVIHASCEDYRAGATLDCQHDATDRDNNHRISCPMLALWGAQGRAARRGSMLDIWRNWATDVQGESLDCGHFLPEEQPEQTVKRLIEFF
jgi:haloacetate dehalogenase